MHLPTLTPLDLTNITTPALQTALIIYLFKMYGQKSLIIELENASYLQVQITTIQATLTLS